MRPASREEYEKIILAVEEQDVAGIVSLPVACDKAFLFLKLPDSWRKAIKASK
ncbi:MAG: hypothetical protein R2875_12440 [Desulfobacterales bacterium]